MGDKRRALTPDFARHLVDASREALVALSLDGRVLSWNRGAEAIFDYTTAEAVGRALVDLIVPADERDRAETAHDPVSTPPPGSVAVRRRKDGSRVVVEISRKRVRPPRGDPFEAVTMRDVTELERLRDRPPEPRPSKLDFLGSMSHELRTPLNSVIGFAGLMHGGKVGEVSGVQREYLGDILASARRLLKLINDVLDLARIDSGSLQPSVASVDVAEIAREVRESLRIQAEAKRIHVTIDVDPATERAKVDPRMLGQVLSIYLSNALTHTAEGGRVAIRVGPEPGHAFRVEVEDTGVGIEESDMGKLFVEFQQLEVAGAGGQRGSGLGLALARRYVEAQGGHVEASSVRGRGSTFSAVLPREVVPRGPDFPPRRRARSRVKA
jgi:PAS domain S-box-containing protein